MQVPERILVAGGNSHVAAKNLPRELQFENSVLSPSPEQVRAIQNILIIEQDYSLNVIDDFIRISTQLLINFRFVFLLLRGRYG